MSDQHDHDAAPPADALSTAASTNRSADTQGRRGLDDLAAVLGDLARTLQALQDTHELLSHIVDAAVREIDGADYGGITLIEDKQLRTAGATDPIVERLDVQQYELRDGPCVTSLREQVTVRSDDLTVEQRWPQWTPFALDEGVGSMLAVQLYVEGENLGALNLFGRGSNAFTLEDEHTAMTVAAHASVAVKEDRVANNLRTALHSRDVIGQAKGILMERYRVSEDDAFGLLVMSSQRTHRKLRDIADHLTATGELPTGS